MLELHDLDAEKAVVGTMITAPETSLDVVADKKLTESHMYHPQTRVIFSAIMTLGASCDPVMVMDAVKRQGDSVPFELIEDCLDRSFEPHLEHHCEVLIDKFNRRRIRTAAEGAIDDCGKDLEPIDIASTMAHVAVEISDVEKTIDKTPIRSEIRLPKMTRLRISRPISSVPNG